MIWLMLSVKWSNCEDLVIKQRYFNTQNYSRIHPAAKEVVYLTVAGDLI